MKKLISFMIILVVMISAAGCGEKEKEAGEPNDFPLGTEKVNEILSDNGLDMYAVPLEFENTLEDTVVEYYNIFHSADDMPAGSISVSDSPVGVTSHFSYYTIFDDYYKKDGAVERAVNVACDTFGNITEKAEIAQELTAGVEKRQLVAGGETHRYWHGQYGDIYVLALYLYNTLEDIDNDVLKFGYIEVMNEDAFRNHLEQNIKQEWAQQIYDKYFVQG